MRLMRLPPQVIGNLAYYLGKLLLKTQHVETVFHPQFNENDNGIFGFWHDKQLAPLLLFAKYANRKRVALVSPSYDGQIIATWLRRLGYSVVKGSSNKSPRTSLVKLIDAAQNGFCVGIAADGPRGPRYQAKSGLAFIAHKSDLPIVPVGVAYSKKWIAQKAWDKFQFPLPFSKIVFYVGAPFWVKVLEGQETNAKISEAILAADKTAQKILQGEIA